MNKKFKNILALLPVMLISIIFYSALFVSNANAALSVSPLINNADNLIAATGTSWKYTVTTTADLVAGDVFKFIFPTVQGQPFSAPGTVTVSTADNFWLYTTAVGAALSNILTGPSLENNATGWSGYQATTTLVGAAPAWNIQATNTAKYGVGAVVFDATSTTQLAVYQNVTMTTSATYTISYWARAVNLATSSHPSVTVLANGVSCAAGSSYAYNFVSGAWECANINTSLIVSSSPYISSSTVTTTNYARASVTIAAPSTSTYPGQLTVYIKVGGIDTTADEAAIVDGVQAESGSSATTFNLGGNGPASEGAVYHQGQGDSNLIYGFVTSTISSGSVFNITLGGINNGIAQRSNVQNLVWTVQAGTPASSNAPWDAFSGDAKFNATSTAGLVRSGGNFVIDGNTGITVSNSNTSTLANYTFKFTPTSSVPMGGKIVLQFPSNYNNLLGGISISTTQYISVAQTTTSTISSFATSTTNDGATKIELFVGNVATHATDTLAIVIYNVTNPATAGVYGGESGGPASRFSQYTAKSNGGVIDGTPYGNESGDFTQGQPPPPSSIHIGGSNTVNVIVYKQVNGVNTLLTGTDLDQVKIGMGCPDKLFFIGERFLNASSSASYSKILDCNYIVGSEPFNKGSSAFYDSFLVPAMKSVSVVGGTVVTTSLVFGIPDTTTTLRITGGVPNQNAFINANSADFQSFTQVFTDTSYATAGFSSTGTGYVRLKVKSGQSWSFTVQSGEYGSGANFSSGTTKYWPPTIPSYYYNSSGTVDIGDYAYVQADKNLVVTLQKAGTSQAVSNACVGVKRSGGNNFFMPPQDQICQPNGTGDNANKYVFKVPAGSVGIQLMRAGFGKPEEYPVAISAVTTTKTISLSVLTSGISVRVQDGSGNSIKGAPVFASGAGFADGQTDSTGSTTLYVAAGTYSVDGFAPGFGPLTRQTGVVVANNSTTSVTFTVNTGALKTISGQVTASSTGLSGVKVGAHGIGGTTGGNGAETDSSGNYTLYVPAGKYEVGGWSSDTGGLTPQNVDVSSASASSINWSLNGQGYVQVTLQNASAISPLFAGAFNPANQRGNGTDSWTTSGNNKVATISLPAGDYKLSAGSPITGPVINNQSITITAGETTAVTADVNSAVSLITVSGSVTSESVGIANTTVWASKVGAPGFYSTQTDSNGAYSFQLPQNTSYKMGARVLGYVSATGDFSLTVTTTNAYQAITLTASGSNTISGQVTNASSGAAINSGWVRARKVVSSSDVWTGGPTDANGNYSLSVDSGSWTVYADGPGYLPSSGTQTTVSGATTVNISLTANSGYSAPTPEVQAFTDTTGGQINKGNIILDIPANALGLTQNSVSVSVVTTSLVRSAANASTLANNVQTITATQGTTAITRLGSSVSLTMNYSPADLPVGYDESKLQLGYFDTDTGQWEAVATTVNTTTHQLTANITHLTDYGPVVGGPSAPTSLTATAASSNKIDLSWTASAAPTADYYAVYATTNDITTFPVSTLIATTTATTYSHNSLSASQTWYYKVAGVNTLGEGPNSSRASAATAASTSTSSNTGSTGGGQFGGSLPVVALTPASITIKINNDATSTDHTNVSLAFAGVNLAQMMVANDVAFSSTSWENFAAVKNWVLTEGAGAKIVYVKFRSSTGVESAVLRSAIYLLPGYNKVAVKPVLPVTVLATTKKSAPPAAIVNLESNIIIIPPIKTNYQPNEKLIYTYSYTNSAAKTIKVKLQRDLLYKNKLVKRSAGSRTIKPGGSFTNKISETIPRSYKPGDYTIVIKVLNQKNKVLDQNSFTIAVEKEKKKYLTVGEVNDSESDLSIDSAVLAKANNKSLPVSFRIKFSYTNNGDVRQVVRMIRELLNEDGKAIQSKSNKWIMAPGEKDTISVTQALANNLPAGNYTLRLAAYDWKTKELFAENSVPLIVGLK